MVPVLTDLLILTLPGFDCSGGRSAKGFRTSSGGCFVFLRWNGRHCGCGEGNLGEWQGFLMLFKGCISQQRLSFQAQRGETQLPFMLAWRSVGGGMSGWVCALWREVLHCVSRSEVWVAVCTW